MYLLRLPFEGWRGSQARAARLTFGPSLVFLQLPSCDIMAADVAADEPNQGLTAEAPESESVVSIDPEELLERRLGQL